MAYVYDYVTDYSYNNLWSCPCAWLIKHCAMKEYGVVDV
jgi:hypothetical protein